MFALVAYEWCRDTRIRSGVFVGQFLRLRSHTRMVELHTSGYVSRGVRFFAFAFDWWWSVHLAAVGEVGGSVCLTAVMDARGLSFRLRFQRMMI